MSETDVTDKANEDKLDVREFHQTFVQEYGQNYTLSQLLYDKPTPNQTALILDTQTDVLSYQNKNGQLTALARFDNDVTADMLRNSLVV